MIGTLRRRASAFIAVANEGSLSRAADRLGIGRSAVSRSVQKLEGQLETGLFLRNPRSSTITRDGELFDVQATV